MHNAQHPQVYTLIRNTETLHAHITDSSFFWQYAQVATNTTPSPPLNPIEPFITTWVTKEITPRTEPHRAPRGPSSPPTAARSVRWYNIYIYAFFFLYLWETHFLQAEGDKLEALST